MQYDFIIVGQGIAGSLLAHSLRRAGATTLVIDASHHNSSSMVAAGIINPISGPRLHLVSQFGDYWEHAHQMYGSLHHHSGTQYLYKVRQHRLLKTSSEIDYYQKRLCSPLYQNYLGNTPLSQSMFANKTHPVVEVTTSAYVDIKSLLSFIKKDLQGHSSLLEETFVYDDVDIKNSRISYRGIRAQAIVFCEGHQIRFNPWFSYLPLNPSKGEILTLESTTIQDEILQNWGHWLLPTHDHRIMLGANFTREQLNCTPSNAAKEFLLESAKEHLKHFSYHLVAHQAGIRPTTIGHMPFIGRHPQHHNLICFNGFGSKACLKVPYYSKCLVDHLMQDASLPKDVTRCL